ncbi:MAG: hypothetical protein G3M70_02575 [Candidatus Nitronauta litoralis]|uniref:Uncharacterized protein n=1 Tax=Candidatus Nitronauta litoralis TaxID=2705533 RepID=A0A7T0FYS7_9BACT|nr:MAG: hypothetical protein G3M70_02575 [Candidatus Nitronauta litoralis]
MDLSIQKVSQIFRTYRKQERIAELNRQSSLKTVQQQQDQVSISTKAREQLQAGKTEGTEKSI